MAIDKKLMFGLLEIRYAPSKGGVLSGVTEQINDLDKVDALELGKCYQPLNAYGGGC